MWVFRVFYSRKEIEGKDDASLGRGIKENGIEGKQSNKGQK